MRTVSRLWAAAAANAAKMLIAILALMQASCARWGTDVQELQGEGTLSVHFSEYAYRETRASGEIPDTSDFILKITASDGSVLYDGRYGDSPENLIVKAGTYDVSVRSGTFAEPAFSAPLYGDDQCVVVSAGSAAEVYLECVQMNAGIRLKIAGNFLTSYPGGSLHLKSSGGKLMYSYTEKRIAYFEPGNVTLVLSDGGGDRILCTKALKAKEVLVLSVSAPQASSSGGIHVAVDTSRTWSGDSCVIGDGGDAGGSSREDALNVSEAKSEIGAEDVWVYGYIVGGDMTASSISFSVPFSSSTNIAIAGRTTVADKEACLSVQLAKGKVRDALNLVDNPGNLKRKVYLKGDIAASYYGIPGIKNVSDYFIE